MKHDSSITVAHSNLNYAFMKFQEQYKNLCQNISTEKRRSLIRSFKKAGSFIFEYLSFVETRELRDEFNNSLSKLKEELFNDTDYLALCEIKQKTPTQAIAFNQKYYFYLVRILKLIGLFGDELSKTFMPNTTDRVNLFRYSNNNSFFEQFTTYKSHTADKISSFSMREFKEGFAYFLGFYFAYYLFIDEKSRFLCEKIFTNVLNIVLTREVLNLIVKRSIDLTKENKKTLRDLDFKLHGGLNNIFFRCNYSYSSYNILPRVEQKLLLDRTAI